MNIIILTLFPEIIENYFQTSIMSKAVTKGLVKYTLINFRCYANDKHKSCDDYPYGGGPGMIIKPGPIFEAMKSLDYKSSARIIYPSPSGFIFNQAYAEELSAEQQLIFICGHYEGIDQRVIDNFVTDEISIGDYVLSSGEIGSLAIIDTVFRCIEGVINYKSLEEESFKDNLLEYPQYTRPKCINGMDVPEVLLSGHHAKIKTWRKQKQIELTEKRRPDLIKSKNGGKLGE